MITRPPNSSSLQLFLSITQTSRFTAHQTFCFETLAANKILQKKLEENFRASILGRYKLAPPSLMMMKMWMVRVVWEPLVRKMASCAIFSWFCFGD